MDTNITSFSQQKFQVGGFYVNFSEELGRGGFGTVYKATSKNNVVAAVKRINKRNGKKAVTEEVKFHYLKETIVHQNVISVLDVKWKGEAIWIIMEYCDLGDLNNFHKHYGDKLLNNIESKMVLMKQITKGIGYLHSKDLVHRDIKPENVLIKLTPKRHALVKLGDCGLSKILDPDDLSPGANNKAGNLRFKAPEFWDKEAPNNQTMFKQSDVYSAGLIFAALLQAKPGRILVPRTQGLADSGGMWMPAGLQAFTRLKDGHQAPELELLNDDLNDSDDDTTKQVKHVIREMTEAEADQRPSAKSVSILLPNLVSTTCHLLPPANAGR